jgi:hypothetical protein
MQQTLQKLYLNFNFFIYGVKLHERPTTQQLIPLPDHGSAMICECSAVSLQELQQL